MNLFLVYSCRPHNLTIPVAFFASEIATFFAEPLVQRTQDPLLWWKVNEHRLPMLADVAKSYLAPPPSSVQSEHVLSSAGGVLDEHRTRLTYNNAETLIFLKFNLPLLNFEY